MLSVMAAIRLDDKSDNIDNTLSLALVETNRSDSSFDPLASSSWDEVMVLTISFLSTSITV